MQDIQIGIRIRAIRHRLGWRQQDLADRAGVSQHVISLIERGELERVTLRKLRRVARELDADLQAHLRWRGGDLDRLVDSAHAGLVGAIVELLKSDGWEPRVEVSYSVYGERGSIDVLAWHPATRTLLVVEVKTELVSVEETLRKHDEKARLAPGIAVEQFGVRPGNAVRLLVLPSTATPRRHVERHDLVMRAAYAVRGVQLRRWLARPAPGVRGGLLFLPVRGEGVPRRKRIRA